MCVCMNVYVCACVCVYVCEQSKTYCRCYVMISVIVEAGHSTPNVLIKMADFSTDNHCPQLTYSGPKTGRRCDIQRQMVEKRNILH